MRAAADGTTAGPDGPARSSAPDTYKPHIDGLRAVSIIAVVAFHAGFQGFRGGFVGVDIFFVISGFLIINQIVAGLGAGRFSIWDFYARRALRILPAYGAMLLFTVLVAAVLLRSPADLGSYALSALLAPLFLTNFYFLASSGYFDTGADLKPLLHTWSLAVEEQFYLVVPMLLVGLFLLARRRGWPIGRVLGIAAAAIGIASFVGCVIFTPPDLDLWVGDKNPAFFMTWWRAWEFVAGGLVAAAAAAPWHRGSRLVATLTGLAGAVLIGLAVGFVGLQWLGIRLGALDRVLGYPGHAAALPVAGAVLVILSGLINPRSPVAWLLSLAPLVYVGQISYALYLWHWPLLVFGRFLPLDVAPALVDWIAIGIAVALSMATRAFIELPILAWRRRIRLGADRGVSRRIALAGIPAALAVTLVSGAIVGLSYWRAADNPMTARVAAAEVWGTGPCVQSTLEAQLPCFDPDPRPLGLLVGDSHALATMPRIAHEAEQNGTRLLQLTAPGCNPQHVVLDRAASYGNMFCKPFAEKLDRFLPKIGDETKFVIFDGYWTAILRGEGKAGSAVAEKRFRDGFRGLLAMFAGNGTRRMLILGPLPNFERADPFNCVEISGALGLSADRCGMPRPTVDAMRERVVAIMREVVAEFPDARFVDPIDIFCDERICMPVKDGTLAFRDDHHLNAFGAEAVYKAFEPDFLWAFKG